MRRDRTHAKRIKVSNKVTTDTVGTDDHQRTDTVEDSAFHLLIAQAYALLRRLGLNFFTSAFDFGLWCPFASQGSSQIVCWHWWPIGAGPAGAFSGPFDGNFIVTHRLEECLPAFIDRIRVGGVARIHLFEVFGVVPLHKGGGVKLVVSRVVGHGLNLE